MRNLLIVDDEKNIRLGLKAMIDRAFLGDYTFFLAEDGEKALSIMDEIEVDLMITDIRMPGMDGIELINLLQQRPKRPEIIILSGHDDFQYAREAIRCDVKEYLLKPIVREELFGTLRRLEAEITRKEEVSEQLQDSIRMRDDFLETQLNYMLMNDQISPDEMREQMIKAGLEVLEHGYYLGLVYISENKHTHNRLELLSRIDGVLDHNKEPGEQIVRFFDKFGAVIILSNNEEAFRRLWAYMTSEQLVNARMAISELQCGVETFKEAYQQAGYAWKHFFLQATARNGIIRFESVKNKDMKYTLPVEEIRKISNMLGSVDREAEMKRLLLQVLNIKTILLYDISYIEKVSAALNEMVFDKVFQVYGEESIDILKLYRSVGNIYNFDHFHDYFHSVESLLTRLNDYVLRIRTVHDDRNEMKRAIEYIQENYQKDLNMAMVSNHVSLNYSYFSQAFKEYTKESFVNYLKKIRLLKAKELLETTDLRVYEISALAGFENTKHFSRVFREMEGITPLEYRAQKEALS
ncbi:MAG: response regulator [Gorillibacterium sp.]|nr:response regulator [Gorillibacterium sp.]